LHSFLFSCLPYDIHLPLRITLHPIHFSPLDCGQLSRSEDTVTSPDIFHSDPRALANLMDVSAEGETLWPPDQLAAIFEHLLSAAIEPELRLVAPGLSLGSDEPAGREAAPIRTFRDLLEHPHPPVELLELTKSFAKRCREGGESLLPDEVASLLYLSAIVAARTRCGRPISRLDDQALLQGLGWALRQSWLDPSVCELLRQGREAILAAGGQQE